MNEKIPAIVQRWCAPQDRNGNGRRVFVIWSSDGTIVHAIDEGYNGRRAVSGMDLTDLGDIKVTATEYRDILKEYGS